MYGLPRPLYPLLQTKVPGEGVTPHLMNRLTIQAMMIRTQFDLILGD